MRLMLLYPYWLNCLHIGHQRMPYITTPRISSSAALQAAVCTGRVGGPCITDDFKRPWHHQLFLCIQELASSY